MGAPKDEKASSHATKRPARRRVESGRVCWRNTIVWLRAEPSTDGALRVADSLRTLPRPRLRSNG